MIELRKTLFLPLGDLLAVTREFLCADVSHCGLNRCPSPVRGQAGFLILDAHPSWVGSPVQPLLQCIHQQLADLPMFACADVDRKEQFPQQVFLRELTLMVHEVASLPITLYQSILRVATMMAPSTPNSSSEPIMSALSSDTRMP